MPQRGSESHGSEKYRPEMNRPETDGIADGLLCPRSIDAPLHAQGILPVAEQESFDRHLGECSICRSALEEANEVFAELRRVSPTISGRDLLPDVLARIAAAEKNNAKNNAKDEATTKANLVERPRRRVRISLAAAALLLAGLLFASGRLLRRLDEAPPGPEGALERALAWLEHAQEPAGGWSAVRWGGQARFDVGLTGLGVLALLSADRSPPAAAWKAVEAILAAQEPDGCFGPEFSGTLYNHGIATVALLRALGSPVEDQTARERLHGSIDRAIDRAIAFTRATQSPPGGWGYLGGEPGMATTAATFWPLQSLLLARASGRKGLDEAIAGGFAHLKRVSDAEGRIGYRRPGEFPNGSEALTSMGAICVLQGGSDAEFGREGKARLLDGVVRDGFGREKAGGEGGTLYGDFLRTQAIEAHPGPAGLSGRHGPQKQGPQKHWPQKLLASAQVQSGPEAGSWEPSDKWSAAGGRVYSTALAALILRSKS